MSNKGNIFQSITYRRDQDRIIRRHECISDSYHTESGGFMPQEVVHTRENEVKSTDADYADAVDYCDEMDRAEYEFHNDI